MIVLRKLKVDAVNNNVVIADSLSGITDGDNQTFTVSYEYSPGHIEIVYDGQVLNSPEDFEETDSKEIRFIYLKPIATTILRANYLIAVPGERSSLNFVDLADTPTAYSGFENYYVKVNSTGNGLDFVSPVGDTQEGILNIPNGVISTTVPFDVDFDSSDYVLTVNLENKIDTAPSIYPTLVRNKAKDGFTVDFSGEIDSSNYYLNWRATLSGSGLIGSSGASCSGITELSEDTSPELGGHLGVGDHLIMLDPHPNGLSIHGYSIGYSGEASEMVVYDNPTGFACPLYMRSDGEWAACTAVSGTTHMPCTAMALEEDEGLKKILWRGNIRKSSWNWTPGQKIYVSTVEGAITNVKPNGGAWSQVIGVAISSDTIRFDPDLSSENPYS